MALTKRNLQELKQAKNLGIHILKKQQAWISAELDPDKIKNTNTSIYQNWHVFTNIKTGAVRHNAESALRRSSHPLRARLSYRLGQPVKATGYTMMQKKTPLA